jgi:hypothetical protein
MRRAQHVLCALRGPDRHLISTRAQA